jgi:DUF1680 family protein
MKIILIICLCFCTEILSAQKILLDGKWKYANSDSAQYNDPDFNARAWTEADVEKLNGGLIGKTPTWTRWFRKTIVIPASFKALAAKTGTFTLHFPNITGGDVCYVNGREVGKTADNGADRFYLVRESDLHFDAVNLIAIHVIKHDWAGLFPVPELMEAQPDHFLTLSPGNDLTNRFLPKARKVNYALVVENKLQKPQPATVIASFQDGFGRELDVFRSETVLKIGTNRFDFEYLAKTDLLKVVYTVQMAGFDSNAPVLNAVYGYQDLEYYPASPVISPLPKDHFQPAIFSEQSIAGWLGIRLDVNVSLRLKKVEEAKLLAGFVNRPGEHFFIGEHIGKFLEAACNSYQFSKDPELKVLIDRMAQQLIASQLIDGYLGTYTSNKYWTSWDVWSHKYNLIGLLSYYQLSGYKPALEAAEKIGDLLNTTFGTNPGQKDIIAAGNHVGMAATSVLDPMVDLYRFAGKKKYLDFCKYIISSYDQSNGPKIMSSLNEEGRVDKVANAKAYEMLSNLVGLVKLYKITNDEQYIKPIVTAWKDVSEKRLYITGTSSSREAFRDDNELPAGTDDHMGEGCVTTTWIQLNYQLFTLLGKMEFLNELERTVYNHLLGAENPQTGCVSYYTPLMGKKPYGCNICCCMSSIPRAIAMIPLFADGAIENNPTILFYQPGVFKTTVGKTAVEFKTETRFPVDGNVSITVTPAIETKFKLQLRIPYWATGFSVSVNKVKQTVNSTEMAAIDRLWKNGDKVDVSFSMPVKILDGGKSYPGQVALKRGPQVLAFDQSLNKTDAAKVSISAESVQLKEVEGVLPQGWIGTQAYQIDAMANGAPVKIILVPFCDASQSGGVVSTWLNKN